MTDNVPAILAVLFLVSGLFVLVFLMYFFGFFPEV